MDYMTTKEAVKKWNISERRIRKLLKDGRINGAVKIGNSWSIPTNAAKPSDRRTKKENNYIINLDKDYFIRIEILKEKLNIKLLEKNNLLRETIASELIYNSNRNNFLSLEEVKIVLNGITIGNKTIKEHLEVINYKQAIDYIENLLDDNLTEKIIKEINQILLTGISNNTSKYREEELIIKKNKYLEYQQISEYMEKLIENYQSLQNYHPIVKATIMYGELQNIYPFINENNKTANLIMNLVLTKNGYLPINISSDEYYEYLNKAYITKNYTELIILITTIEEKMLNHYLTI